MKTIWILVITVALGLLFYLPREVSRWWQEFNQPDTITIYKPIGDSPDLSTVVGFTAKADPDEVYTLVEADRWEYGTGSMQHQPEGTKYSYRQIAQLVANQSDNMGAEILIKKLGGYNSVQRIVNGLGLTNTNLKENETTPAEIGGLYQRLLVGEVFSPGR